jgi:hypothetical protein
LSPTIAQVSQLYSSISYRGLQEYHRISLSGLPGSEQWTRGVSVALILALYSGLLPRIKHSTLWLNMRFRAAFEEFSTDVKFAAKDNFGGISIDDILLSGGRDWLQGGTRKGISAVPESSVPESSSTAWPFYRIQRAQ